MKQNIDDFIAREVLGWRLLKEEDVYKTSYWVDADGKPVHLSEVLPPFSKSIGWVFKFVVEPLKSMSNSGFILSHSVMSPTCYKWKAEFGNCMGRAENPSEAICEAAIEIHKQVLTSSIPQKIVSNVRRLKEKESKGVISLWLEFCEIAG